MAPIDILNPGEKAAWSLVFGIKAELFTLKCILFYTPHPLGVHALPSSSWNILQHAVCL